MKRVSGDSSSTRVTREIDIYVILESLLLCKPIKLWCFEQNNARVRETRNISLSIADYRLYLLYLHNAGKNVATQTNKRKAIPVTGREGP
jgi:hypothetical protein